MKATAPGTETVERRRSRTLRIALGAALGVVLGIALVLLTALLGFGPGAGAGALVILLSLAVLCFLAVRWLARRLLFGVGRRLLVSYLLVGVVPPLLLTLFVMALLYVLAGQLAALRAESALSEHAHALRTWAATLDPSALASGGRLEPPTSLAGEGEDASVAWRTADGASGSAGSLPLAALLPASAGHDGFEGFGRSKDGAIVVFAIASGARGLVLAAQPLEPVVRRAIEVSTDVAVTFPQEGVADGDGDVVVNFDGRGLRTVTTPTDSAGGGEPEVRRDPFADTASTPGTGGPLRSTWVLWGRLASLPFVELPSFERSGYRDDGEPDAAADVGAPAEEDTGGGLFVVVRTSIAREYFALFGGLRGIGVDEDVGEGALVAVRVLLIVTLVASGLIGLVAAVLVQRVALAAARLHRGFEQVARGNFEARAKLGGHDQLADLVSGFNRMVAGLQQGITERAERDAIERELAAARELQRRLLPGVEASFPGFDVAVRFDPAAAIGGDLYQYWQEDDGALRVVVGDVSGHGLATGIVMAAATALVWAQARDSHDATELFRSLDRQVRGITDARTFLTLQHCRFEPATLRAFFTNAGHPYPFRLSSSGELSTVESSSRPLGLTLPAAYSTVAVPFAPGDLWCFYSDGLVEASGPGGEPFGFERLRAALTQCAGAGASAARDQLLAEWRAFVGDREPDDDCTLILVRVGDRPVPAAEPARSARPAKAGPPTGKL